MENGRYFEKIRHGGIAVVFFGALFIFFWSVFTVVTDRIHLITATASSSFLNYIVSPIVVIWLLISVGWLIFLIVAPSVARLAQTLKS